MDRDWRLFEFFRWITDFSIFQKRNLLRSKITTGWEKISQPVPIDYFCSFRWMSFWISTMGMIENANPKETRYSAREICANPKAEAKKGM